MAAKMKKKRKAYAFDWIVMIILGLFAIVTLYPFVYALAASFNTGPDFELGGVWLYPRKFTLENYKVVFTDTRFWFALRNTVIRTFLSTLVALLFTSMVAYGMHRPELRHKQFYQWANIITMFISGGLIPQFMVYTALGFYNNFLLYIIPPMYSVYNMIIISKYYSSIENELHEAAVIDGAGEFHIWLGIYVPIAKPILLTVGLWLIAGNWNSWFTTMIYSDAENNMIVLQYYLKTIIGGLHNQNSDFVSTQTVSMAAVIVSSLPILAAYPFMQKHLTQGVNVGSVKG